MKIQMYNAIFFRVFKSYITQVWLTVKFEYLDVVFEIKIGIRMSTFRGINYSCTLQMQE